jgi:hypothetical protein
MLRLFLLVFSIPILSCSKGNKPMSDLISPSKTVDSILVRIKASDVFKPSEIKAYHESTQVYPLLITKMRDMDSEAKASCLQRFQDLGAIVDTSTEDGTLFVTPYIGNLTLIHALVDCLGDTSMDVREEADRALTENVPDLFIRNFSKELIDHVSEYPNLPDAAELLAKTGSERARALIRSNSIIRKASDFTIKKSLAKLGDSALENEFITSYKKEEDMREKRDLAYALGFIASPKTILTLAQDLRTPVTYPWNQRAPRSFRVHVIEGLGFAYPMEAVFWRPNSTPRTDAYYDGVEAWVTAHLGVTWKTPRPPFLYEMEVPMRAP